jgi:hypothetical protein
MVATTLEAKFYVFDVRTQHPKKGFAHLTEKVSHIQQLHLKTVSFFLYFTLSMIRRGYRNVLHMDSGRIYLEVYGLKTSNTWILRRISTK